MAKFGIDNPFVQKDRIYRIYRPCELEQKQNETNKFEEGGRSQHCMRMHGEDRKFGATSPLVIKIEDDTKLVRVH